MELLSKMSEFLSLHIFLVGLSELYNQLPTEYFYFSVMERAEKVPLDLH